MAFIRALLHNETQGLTDGKDGQHILKPIKNNLTLTCPNFGVQEM